MRKTGLLLTICVLAFGLGACKEEKTGIDAPSPAAAADPADDELPADASGALPAGLLVDGQPVDPFCFAVAYGLEEGLAPVHVKDCVSDELVPGERFSKGPQSYGIDFQYASDADGMAKPYMLYQYVGRDLTLPPSQQPKTPAPLPALNEKFPILLYFNTGGTGNFSTLVWVQRAGDMIKQVEAVAGGDRCNGGIEQAIIDQDGALVYEQNITPYDMLVLGGDEDRLFLNNVKAFDDLDACAVCCAGTAVYKGDQFSGVKLGSDLAENIKSKYMSPVPPEQEKQACFDKALGLHIEKGKTEFTTAEWAAVIGDIEQSCLGGTEPL